MPDPAFVERVEFEERLERLDAKVDSGFALLGRRFDSLVEKLEAKAERRAPKLWEVLAVLIAAIGAIGVPFSASAFAIVVNMTETRSLRGWASAHEAFAVRLEADINVARDRLRAVEKALEEHESQHGWMADAANLQDQRLEQLIRIKHPDIHASDYWPLSQIGRALANKAGE